MPSGQTAAKLTISNLTVNMEKINEAIYNYDFQCNADSYQTKQFSPLPLVYVFKQP